MSRDFTSPIHSKTRTKFEMLFQFSAEYPGHGNKNETRAIAKRARFI